MLSNDIKGMADTFSYYVEHNTEMTFDQPYLVALVHELRSFQNQAEALEFAQVPEQLTEPEINESNNHNVIMLDTFRKPSQKTKSNY